VGGPGRKAIPGDFDTQAGGGVVEPAAVRGEERRVGGAGVPGGEKEELEARLRECHANISKLEDEMQSSSLSQAKVFALKKKIALERAAKIRIERALAP